MKTVIVLGNARSGTSITAGLLDILGVKMANDSGSDEGNPNGSFEHSGFNSITTKME